MEAQEAPVRPVQAASASIIAGGNCASPLPLLARPPSALFPSASSVADGEGAQRQPLDGFDDEVDQIILRDPVAQVRRQEQGGLTTDVDEAGGHARF